MSPFPADRPRRLRRTPGLRRAFAETSLEPSDLLAPLFLKEGIADPAPIASMPGQHQHTLESLTKEANELANRGVAGVLLFGVPAHKDAGGTESYNHDGIVQRGFRALKDELGDEAVVIADLCLCEYTEHGHCGILRGESVDNDPTLEAYGRIAVSQADAGADIVAPSGMMDGQVGAIRSELDAEGLARTAALAYLDVLREVKDRFDYPTAAYNVSGEYSMVMAAAERGWIDERMATLEVLTSIR